jgi:chromosomal replication initiator protein
MFNHIIEETCAVWGVTERALRGSGRQRVLAWARQEAYTRLRDESPLSYPEIGRIFDRDHTTIIKGERACRRRIKEGLH